MDIGFDEDTIYYSDQNAFETGRKSSKFNIKDDVTITTNINNKKMNFRVKYP